MIGGRSEWPTEGRYFFERYPPLDTNPRKQGKGFFGSCRPRRQKTEVSVAQTYRVWDLLRVFQRSCDMLRLLKTSV